MVPVKVWTLVVPGKMWTLVVPVKMWTLVVPVKVTNLMHTRLVVNQEVNEKLKDWKDAMAAEYRSFLDKGAIQEVSDQQVRGWLDAGEDVEVLPGSGVPSEKPAERPQVDRVRSTGL